MRSFIRLLDLVLFSLLVYFVWETWSPGLTSEGTKVLTAQNRLWRVFLLSPTSSNNKKENCLLHRQLYSPSCFFFLHRFVGGTSGSKCQVWLQRVGRRTLFRPNGGRCRSTKAVRSTQSSTCWTSRYRHRSSHFTSSGKYFFNALILRFNLLFFPSGLMS